MAPNPKIKLGDIAEKTGVTRMAVSLALRGKAGVSRETRAKVLRVAEELGYRPDPEVSSLMARIRSRTPAATKSCLALLTYGPVTEGSKRSITERKYVEGVIKRADEYGYRTEEFLIQSAKDSERVCKILWNRGIEGVIIRPVQHELLGKSPGSTGFDFGRFSSVAISETLGNPDLDRSLHNQYTSMLKAVSVLTEMNYRKIGLVLEEELNLRTNGRWTGAFLQHTFRSGGMSLPPPLIMAEPKQGTFDRWFEAHQPDVILSVNPHVPSFIRNRGLTFPKDIGYASLDLDGDYDGKSDLSGIDQNSCHVGAVAVDMMVSAIQRGQRGIPEHPVRIEVEGVWHHGSSVKRRLEGNFR